MGAKSLGCYRVRLHTITDYTIEANVIDDEDLKRALLHVYESEGMEGLVAEIEKKLVEGDASIVGSHALDVNPTSTE